jgi:hypothetical protein
MHEVYGDWNLQVSRLARSRETLRALSDAPTCRAMAVLVCGRGGAAMTVPFRYVRALADEIRARGTEVPEAERRYLAGAPPDLEILDRALAETKGYFTLGQWELGIGGADHARAVVSRVETDDEEESAAAAQASGLSSLYIVANNAGGLVIVAGWNAGDPTCRVYRVDESHGEECRPYDHVDDWVLTVIATEEAHDRRGMIAAVNARTPSQAKPEPED